MPAPLPRSAPRARARHAVLLAAGALVAAAPGTLRAQGPSPFTSLTFFGDSYVDTGNLLLLTGGAQPPTPPYATGRVSNGLVWVDYFAQALGRPQDAAPVFLTRAASGNYAVAGARTTGSTPPGTDQQVGSYLTRPGATPATRTDPTGLYALFAGGNDLRDAAALSDPVARQAAATLAAQRVVTQAGQLAGSGARNVLLFTFPSLGATPEAQRIPGRPAAADEVAATFNQALLLGIGGLQSTFGGTSFLNLRLDNLFTNILADAQRGGTQFGLTNVTTRCLPPFASPGAPSCDVSLWADDLHPTTRTHQLIAQAAVRYVTTGQNVAVVPEPATVALVAGGLVALGGIGAARRRRAA